MRKILYTIFILLFLGSCTEVEKFVEDILAQAPSDSTGIEDVEDKTLEKSAESEETIGDWEFHGESKYDKDISFDDKEGSLRLGKTANTWNNSDRVTSSQKYEVIPGRTYQIKFQSYIKNWPPPTLHVFAEIYKDERNRMYNSDGSYFSNSRINLWEDNLVIVNIQNDSNIKFISPRFVMLPKHSINEDVWVDNITISEVRGNLKAIIKREFNGTKVRADYLGNLSIKNNNKYNEFFPIGIYGDNNRKDWSIYSKQGFNCYMWASDWRQVKKAKEAGLMSSIQVGPYIIGGNWLPNNKSERINHLSNFIKDIRKYNLQDQIVFYYIDNEFYKIDQHTINVIEKVKSLDVDNNGDRLHPIYMLNGAYGQARKYNDLVDITGTYVAQDRTNIPIAENFTGLQINENQNLPAVMAQINRGVGKNFRPVLFGAIAKGAKGMGFWRDGGSGEDITKKPWWNDFPNMVNEIEQMMPLIKEPHFTNWSVTCDNDDLIFGSRTYQNKGHLIIANPTKSTIIATFTITDLPYQLSNVNDYFTGRILGDSVGNTISISIDAHGSKVVRLD